MHVSGQAGDGSAPDVDRVPDDRRSEPVYAQGRGLALGVSVLAMVAVGGFLFALAHTTPAGPVSSLLNGTSLDDVRVSELPGYGATGVNGGGTRSVLRVEAPLSDLPVMIQNIEDANWQSTSGMIGPLKDDGSRSVAAACPHDLYNVTPDSDTYAFCTFSLSRDQSMTLHVQSGDEFVEVTYEN